MSYSNCDIRYEMTGLFIDGTRFWPNWARAQNNHLPLLTEEEREKGALRYGSEQVSLPSDNSQLIGGMAQSQGWVRRYFKAFCKGFFVAVPVAVTFLDQVACVARVEGTSMQPSLNPGGSQSSDVVLLNHWKVRNFEVQRGDIVSLVLAFQSIQLNLSMKHFALFLDAFLELVELR
ncbi:hypothetical protein MG293_006514 [Ovis ammon polii]|nr:hypothetical protein MG293_006514 [Ovis ammon polii]